MANPSQSLSRDIAAEPARVWSVLTDLERAPEIMSGVSGIERLDDGPFRLGTSWRETRSSVGRDGIHERTVTELQALGLIRVEESDGTTRSATTYKLEALHPGTRLTISHEDEPGDEAGTLAKVAMKVMAPVEHQRAKRSLTSHMDDIATAAESRD